MTRRIIWVVLALLVAFHISCKSTLQTKQVPVPQEASVATTERTEEADHWIKAAESGDSTDQFMAGYIYENGLGVKQNFIEAANWYQKASAQGNNDALVNYISLCTNLGYMYSTGNGLIRDDREAVAWTYKAAKLGGATAQFNLGQFYENGQGVAQDSEEAAKWYLRAANQGYIAAQGSLGYMLLFGRGVKKDTVSGISWLYKVAEQGDARAMDILGYAYQEGIGVIQNKIEAHAWYLLASKYGSDQAKANIENLCHPWYKIADIEEAQRRASIIDQQLFSEEKPESQ